MKNIFQNAGIALAGATGIALASPIASPLSFVINFILTLVFVICFRAWQQRKQKAA